MTTQPEKNSSSATGQATSGYAFQSFKSSGNVPVLNQKRLQDLVSEVDPKQVMDDDVEELLLQMADDFIDGVVESSCRLAKHRKSNALQTVDLQLHLERAWNMTIPGFGSDKQHKKSPATEAHKQRVAMIKKAKR